MAGAIGVSLSLDDVPWAGGSSGDSTPAGVAQAPTGAAGSLAARPDLAFFGEAPTLVLVSLAAVDVERFEDLCGASGVPCTPLGTVGGTDLMMDVNASGFRVPIVTLDAVYESALRRALEE
jgi:hypothetical protein